MSDRAAPDFSLYLISDDDPASLITLAARADDALGAVPRGFAAIQLRARFLDGRALLHAAAALREVTHRHGALLFINDRIDVALAVRADGVHLPSRGIPVADARRIAPSLRLGVSTHDAGEAIQCAKDGADFVTIGPVFPTPSKAGMGEPFGLERLAEAVGQIPAPVFALGGIDLAAAAACARLGARIACIRAVLGASSPARAAAAFFTAITVDKRL